jgi:sugar phosphate permease
MSEAPRNLVSRRRWVVLAVGFFVMASGFALRNGFSVFYPAIVDDLGWSRGDTAVMFSLSILVYGLLSPVVGGLVDRFKPQVVVSLGMIILCGSVVLCARATEPWQFYLLFGVIAASGVSMIGVAPMGAILTPWFGRNRGLVFAVLASGFGVSLVSATLIQYLITTYGWRNSFVIAGVSVAAMSIPLVLLFIRRAPRPAAPAAAAAAQSDPTQAAVWHSNVWTFGRAMRTPQFWMLWAVGFCQIGLAEKVAIAHQVYFFQDVGYSPISAASVYSVFGVAFVAGTFVSALSDRLGRERMYLPGCVSALIGVGLLFAIRDANSPWMAYVFATLFGAGMGLMPPVLFAAIADLFHGPSYGAIQGMVVLGMSVGGALSPWLAGHMHDIYGTYDTTLFLLLGALVASGVLLMLAAPRRHVPVR